MNVKSVLRLAVRFKRIVLAIAMIAVPVLYLAWNIVESVFQAGCTISSGLSGVPGDVKSAVFSSVAFAIQYAWIRFSLPIRNVCNRISHLVVTIARKAFGSVAQSHKASETEIAG